MKRLSYQRAIPPAIPDESVRIAEIRRASVITREDIALLFRVIDSPKACESCEKLAAENLRMRLQIQEIEATLKGER